MAFIDLFFVFESMILVMTKFKNTFRIETARLKNWDYTSPWWYFITTCTKEHKEYFGKIENHKMYLNALGRIVEEEWIKTKTLRNNIELDYFVVMPNHFHGILIINESRDVARNVSTENKFSKLAPKAGSLSTIIRSFKSSVTKNIHEFGRLDFAWQARFFDRIIRNENELFNIRRYIEQNPLKWDLEKSYDESIVNNLF